MKKWLFITSFLALFITIFMYGVGVGLYKWFPYDALIRAKYIVTNRDLVTFDNYGRLTSTNRHVEVPCPKQTDKIGFLVAFGQSNSANHAQYRYKSSELAGVLNYFDGRCYRAQSPLLGASSAKGEWISKTARTLIENGIYEQVMVVSTGIGGTPIARWAKGNDLNQMLIDVLVDIQTRYTITEMIWHQGEADRAYTFTDTYVRLFKTMIESIRERGVDAPVFISIASICGNASNYPNRVTKAQQTLLMLDGIEPGVNTDELVTMQMRYDRCHFGFQGQEATAIKTAELIGEYYEKQLGEKL